MLRSPIVLSLRQRFPSELNFTEGEIKLSRQWLSWGSCGPGLLWMSMARISSVSVQGGRSVAPHIHYCIFLWRNLVYTTALTLRPTGVYIQVLTDTFYIEPLYH
ncbi:hypothetical protein XENOCAPTIV_012312 [Xenoophorus captivus]|uniref:Uncharacterized protein n=1 Tax=Xenoophorus captivus TaxID=1517983 RepID=A0ABV0S730_9TELE